MTLLRAIFFGLTQGLSEFLPVSSSGHLYLVKILFQIKNGSLSFFILLHLATILAVAISLRKQIQLALSRQKFLIGLGLITALSCLTAFFSYKLLSGYFESKYFISLFFLVNGVILLSLRGGSGKKNWSNLKPIDILLLGILQGLAIIPGISRSGITITTLLSRGFKLQEAFTISFLMAIPMIFSAFIFQYFISSPDSASRIPLSATVGGFLTAFLAGLIALTVVKKTLVNQKFKNFGYYCLALGLGGVLLH